ncbi:protein kinase domain-containing protein [Candidatus Poriferisodalis sp.]|uniref:protein kinase domain-containing protein n=1 Tax=Candidatus Poriferisodalis sp. TaxID=3101277 RepID=UPI003B52EBC2
MADDPNVFLGMTIGNRYRIEECVGRGYFSFVFKAFDQQDQVPVAVKVLKLGHAGSTAAVLEFDTEGRLLQSLQSRSNIVGLHSSGMSAVPISVQGASTVLNVRFHAMELADLALVDLLVYRDQVSWLDKLSIFRDVVSGLHQMHISHVAHRDLKADNVLLFMVGNRRVAAKVSDLGRSRDLYDSARLDPPAYEWGRGDRFHAPPEHFLGLGRSSEDDFKYADFYLVGSVLCEIISGQQMNSLVPPSSATSQAFLAALPAEREAMFGTWTSRAVMEYSNAISLISGDVPAAIRHQVVELLTQLCHPVPRMRATRQRREQNLPRWGLDWVLRRVDIIIRRLKADNRVPSRVAAQTGP